MQRQVCAIKIADDLDSYEVLVREVRRRNVPLLQLNVYSCALAHAHGVQRRVEVLRSQQSVAPS